VVEFPQRPLEPPVVVLAEDVENLQARPLERLADLPLGEVALRVDVGALALYLEAGGCDRAGGMIATGFSVPDQALVALLDHVPFGEEGAVAEQCVEVEDEEAGVRHVLPHGRERRPEPAVQQVVDRVVERPDEVEAAEPR
jgi:hypothetical protein